MIMNEEKVVSENEINLFGTESIVITRFVNSSLNYVGEVDFGTENVSAEIIDSIKDCSKLMVCGNELYIKSSRAGGVVILGKNDLETLNGKHVDIVIEASDDTFVRVDIPNVANYHKLNRYRFDNDITNSDEIVKFAVIVDKILDCMRKHRKDAPAKGREYIDNEIVGQNDYKKHVLENLLHLGIVYVDSYESHLYKLDVNKLKEYDIGWQTLNSFGVGQFAKLYNSCESL